jgi:hypothetical protein
MHGCAGACGRDRAVGTLKGLFSTDSRSPFRCASGPNTARIVALNTVRIIAAIILTVTINNNSKQQTTNNNRKRARSGPRGSCDTGERTRGAGTGVGRPAEHAQGARRTGNAGAGAHGRAHPVRLLGLEEQRAPAGWRAIALDVDPCRLLCLRS